MVEQRNIPFSPPDITDCEIDEVIDALKSGWITTGPRAKEFERKIAEFIGVKRAVCLNSATAAMELTLRILGVGQGDEVITSAYTYTATASVISHVGATPVLVDTDGESFEMDYDALEKAITERTKVVMPIDLAGRMCNYDKIFNIIEKNRRLFNATTDLQQQIGRITVLSDSAHGFGARRKGHTSGQVADFTTFSFHAVKNLTTAEGGAVVWNDNLNLDGEELYHEYMLASLHGQNKDALAKTKKGSWEYDIIYPAYKCNMTDISAAIGIKQLERYKELLARRKEIIKKYDDAFLPLGLRPLIHFDDDVESSGHLYLLRIPDISEEERNGMINKIAAKGVATNVHYKPLPMLTAYKNMGFDIVDYPNAYDMYRNEITLPLHTKLTKEDVEFVIEVVSDVVKATINGKRN